MVTGLKIDTPVILPITNTESKDCISVWEVLNSIIGSAKAEIGIDITIKTNNAILSTLFMRKYLYINYTIQKNYNLLIYDLKQKLDVLKKGKSHPKRLQYIKNEWCQEMPESKLQSD